MLEIQRDGYFNNDLTYEVKKVTVFILRHVAYSFLTMPHHTEKWLKVLSVQTK